MDQFKCPICELSICEGQAFSVLTQKGSDGINQASVERGVKIHTSPGQKVHPECRKVHCSRTSIEAYKRKRDTTPTLNEQSHKLRSSEGVFDYSSNCLFCGIADPYGGKKSEFKLIPVRTYDFQKQVLTMCLKRNDDWAHKIKSRIEFVNDLHAADAVYHQACSVNFRTDKQIPQKYQLNTDPSVKRIKLGRPSDQDQKEAFYKVMKHLEDNDEEQTTVNDLIQQMGEHLKDKDIQPYGFTYMKEQIQKHFGDKIIITEINGKQNVVTWWSTAATILQDFYAQPKNESSEEEKARIIQTAAKLIKNDMKSFRQAKDVYPQYQEMASIQEACSFLPDSLRMFLQSLLGTNNQLKIASMGQALFQATRPRIILAPLQLGLGIQLHNHFASRFLIDILNKLGFCCSYTEVTKYEKCAAVSSGVQIPNLSPNNFVQYAADNVDHNICTIDGNNTFHGMGMIAIITPGVSHTRLIPRINVTAKDIAAVGQVNIQNYTSTCDGMKSVFYDKLKAGVFDDSMDKVDLLWDISLYLQSPRPNWAGMMQLVHKGNYPGKSSVMFLPMIDINPSDMTCLYSTLLYVNSHARQYGVTPILTFDQPLWWKAVTIQNSADADSEIRSMVLRLGGFHTAMSFLGSIGHIMADTGLQELLESVYANNTVSHMLSGKAYSRAVRGHLLVSTALFTMLVSNAYDVPLPQICVALSNNQEGLQCTTEDSNDEIRKDTQGDLLVNDQEMNQPCREQSMPEILTDAKQLYEDLLAGSLTVEDVQNSEILSCLNEKLVAEKNKLQVLRTAKLWLQYMEMVNILRNFIKAERTGNWHLHLRILQDMLPYLAATGHNNYTKSIHLYLQNMQDLQNTHPEVYKHFEDGMHVGRRSDRYWGGLSQDLLIEQVLMRSLKATGGLTRGRGLTETQRLVWLLSSNACSEVNFAMQELTSVNFSTSEQHKDVSEARQKKDMADTETLINFLKDRNPFQAEGELCSIVTGVTADNTVNVDCAKEVGDNVLTKMAGNCVIEYSFQKKLQVVTLSNKKSVRIQNEEIQVDPQLLFQRLITMAKHHDLSEVLKYELCSYPPALFEDKYMPRLANKATLADELWKYMPEETTATVPSGDIQYILDGGALLHKIPWSKGATFDKTCEQYVQYVARHYKKAVVVFDGYCSGPTIKDTTQKRRAGTHGGPTVIVSGSNVISLRKDEFLANKENKQRFITLLSRHLEYSGCEVHHARADADLLIVQTAVQVAEAIRKPTVVVADDTDVLVLLMFHSPIELTNLFLRPEPRHGTKKTPRCWDICILKRTLGAHVYSNILFVHAVLGCDSTSHVHGLGKGQALKLICQSQVFQEQAAVFQTPNSTTSEVISAGEKALLILYKEESVGSLDELRLLRFHQKVGRATSFVTPEVLPPTSAAAKFHSMRVFLQVQQWAAQLDNHKPEDWGWYIHEHCFLPKLTDKDVAPPYLLEVVRCCCKTDCHTMRCTCRKNGIDCSTACGNCRGVCSNVTVVDNNDDNGYEDE